jgi:hypothetical protein
MARIEARSGRKKTKNTPELWGGVPLRILTEAVQAF